MLRERWPLWKAGLYDLEVVSLRGHYFRTGGLAYDSTRATRAITNHAPIGKYRLKFFPWEDFSCLCGTYPIETR